MSHKYMNSKGEMFATFEELVASEPSYWAGEIRLNRWHICGLEQALRDTCPISLSEIWLRKLKLDAEARVRADPHGRDTPSVFMMGDLVRNERARVAEWLREKGEQDLARELEEL